MTTKTRPFDAAKYLGDDEAIAVYLDSILQENNAALLAAALGNIARAKGMTQIAKDAGMGRETLYKALRADSSPRLETVQRACRALGLRLSVTKEGMVLDDIATELAGTLVPLKWRTVRDSLTAWRKLRSTGTP